MINRAMNVTSLAFPTARPRWGESLGAPHAHTRARKRVGVSYLLPPGISRTLDMYPGGRQVVAVLLFETVVAYIIVRGSTSPPYFPPARRPVVWYWGLTCLGMSMQVHVCVRYPVGIRVSCE